MKLVTSETQRRTVIRNTKIEIADTKRRYPSSQSRVIKGGVCGARAEARATKQTSWVGFDTGAAVASCVMVAREYDSTNSVDRKGSGLRRVVDTVNPPSDRSIMGWSRNSKSRPTRSGT